MRSNFECFGELSLAIYALLDRDREALNFKLRVLDLVETFLRRQPQSPIVLRAVQSLCTTAARYHQVHPSPRNNARKLIFISQAKEKRPLFDRVSALLVNRIGHQKEYAKDVPCDESLRVLRSLLSRLRRTTATGLLLPPLLAAVHFVIKVRFIMSPLMMLTYLDVLASSRRRDSRRPTGGPP